MPKSPDFCIADECDRPIEIKKHQVCRAHYYYLYTKNTLPDKKIRKYNAIKPLSIKKKK